MNRVRDRWWVLLSLLVGLPGLYLFTSAFERGLVHRTQAFIGVGLILVAMLLFSHALLNWFDRNGHLFNAESTTIDTDAQDEPNDSCEVESTPLD